MALPPSAYQQWKESAPEVAVIEVISAETQSRVSETEGTKVQLRRTEIGVDVGALVLSVERTATNLQPDTAIRLRYVHRPLRQQMLQEGKWADVWMTGATPIPMLEKGDKVTAWLRRVADLDFEPAAEAESFAVVPAPTAKTD
jgi:hypothetical protein